ncbi:phosphopyruvate hydratase [Candidatus Deianiraea vastatrix]|uniref:Enolase n=1 Tax=Candidatus Deianiraea vastatrix TaxID=2163644 RepID=A0A5B8XHJ9_9RICK|nr:phosphopyruvate hydratase [Candidatus Deianiraea vastatrix]QED23277.1 Enolase [Candidatus Deianiraea vastatrix]
MFITSIKAIEILDSRGFPTVEVEIGDSDGNTARASVPSGASTGEKEACELRDGDKNYCHGKGVLKAVENVNTIIAEELLGLETSSIKDIDECLIELDGTENKSKLGANAVLATSLAASKLFALQSGLELFEYIGGANANLMPCPMMNVINGGKHADNKLDIQEFMIMPVGAENMKQAIMNGATVFHTLKKILVDKGLSTNVGDEGGFAPQIGSTDEAIELLLTAIEKSGFKPGIDFLLALDCAASEFYDEKSKKYNLIGEGVQLTSDEMIEKYTKLISKYPIFSIEDALCEHDHDGFVKMTQVLGNKLQIVGDDLFCTNPDILSNGIEKKMANALLVKPNQIGTFSQTLKAINIAKNTGYQTIISHRSGETEDDFISHLAVGVNAGQIKTGSLCRTDRTAKYNSLIRIESNGFFEYNGGNILKKFNSFK